MLRTGRLLSNLPILPAGIRSQFWNGSIYKNIYEVVEVSASDSISLKPHFITPLNTFSGFDEQLPCGFYTRSVYRRTVKGDSKVLLNESTDLLPFIPDHPSVLRLPENYMWLPTYVSKGDWIFFWHPGAYITFDFHGVLRMERRPPFMA